MGADTVAGSNERVLIVGFGSIGRRHLANLRQLRPRSRIGVWRLHNPPDPQPPTGADEQFVSLEQALEFAPDAAIIAGPASTHLETALSLAEAGVHLLVEKPLAVDPAGVADLIDRCRARGLVLMTGYNLRFMPSLQAAKECLDRGRIGQVITVRAEVGQYLPDWRPGSDYRAGVSARKALGGGALLELSHELDYLAWFFGVPKRVTARGGHFSTLELDVEDLVELLLEYDTPPRLVSVHLDLLQRAPQRVCRVVGTTGTLVWDGIADCVDLYDAESGAWATLPAVALADRNRMYLDEMRHFLVCVTRGQAPCVDGVDGLRALAIVDAARESLTRETGIEVTDHGC
jgi:predicted dehydrogenase